MNISLIPWWVKALVVAAVIAAYSFFWYDIGYDQKDLEVKTAQLEFIKESQKREDELREKLATTSENLQAALQEVRVEVVYVDKITRTEIEKPVYQACIVPESGVIIMNRNAQTLNDLRSKP